MKLDLLLKKFFSAAKSKRALLFAILAIVFIANLERVKALIVVAVFIMLSGISKIYHRVLKSSIGLDLVLFLTITDTSAKCIDFQLKSLNS